MGTSIETNALIIGFSGGQRLGYSGNLFSRSNKNLLNSWCIGHKEHAKPPIPPVAKKTLCYYYLLLNSLLSPRELIYLNILEAGEYLRKGLFNLAKDVVPVLHEELESKVEKLKYKKLEVM